MSKRFYRSAAKMRLSFVELKICLGKAGQIWRHFTTQRVIMGEKIRARSLKILNF